MILNRGLFDSYKIFAFGLCYWLVWRREWIVLGCRIVLCRRGGICVGVICWFGLRLVSLQEKKCHGTGLYC